MLRQIISINEELCNGCGLCAKACHEGAIKMVNNKAKLIRDDYCDGLGDCLPACPTKAITFVTREAEAYDEEAVKNSKTESALPCGCPGTQVKALSRDLKVEEANAHAIESRLSQWPVQIKLVPVNAPYFNGAKLLIAADCTAFAYGNFHNEFIKNHIVIIGCPKLDGVDYTEKLTAIISENSIKSVTVIKMEVPCCKGIESAVKNALQASGKFLPWQSITVSTNGRILD